MVKKNSKMLALIFLIGICLGLGTCAVYASSADSSWGYYGPFLGYSYQNQARVSDDQGFVDASTYVQPSSGSVPTGYMGCQARLFKDDALYDTTTMHYNDSPMYTMRYYTQNRNTASGIYYSYGITAAYNGNGYSNYYTFKSPSMNY